MVKILGLTLLIGAATSVLACEHNDDCAVAGSEAQHVCHDGACATSCTTHADCKPESQGKCISALGICKKIGKKNAASVLSTNREADELGCHVDDGELVCPTTRSDDCEPEERDENNSCPPPETRNTYTHCAIPIYSLVYFVVPKSQQPIVDKCWHPPSGGSEEATKLKNSTVGIDQQICKMRCPDHRMDPYFALKEGKNDYRVFQATCDCNGQKKGAGICGWKTSGTGIKEFAGGNIMCRFTHFSAKPLFAADYQSRHPDDLEILGNFAARPEIKKKEVEFDESNFKIEYRALEKYWDENGKKKSRFVDITHEHWYYEDPKTDYKGRPEVGTGLKYFPTDMVLENDKGKNENQHNKVEKGVNVRAFISCKSHTNGRFFAVLYPSCKNKRHILKKGRPGYCGWKISEVHPNPLESFLEKDDDPTGLGFDPSYPAGKPIKFSTTKLKKFGLKAKKAEGVIGNLMQASKAWRCPDFIDQRL